MSAGQTLLLDVGTTVLEVARALPPDFRGTVATCSLLVAAELAGRRDVEVLVSGGRVRGGDLSLSNAQTVAFFADVRADLAFLGSGGVDAVAGLTDYHLDEVATRRTIIANAARAFIVADSGKLGPGRPAPGVRPGRGGRPDHRRRRPAALTVAVQGAGGTILGARPPVD